MTLPEFLQASSVTLRNMGRLVLAKTLLWLRKQYRDLEEKSRRQEEENARLQAEKARQEAENARLRQELEKLQEKLRHKEVVRLNRLVNKPSSRKADWERDPEPEPDPDGGGGAPRPAPKGRPGGSRPGSGNQAKAFPVKRREKARVDQCPRCGRDLGREAACASSNIRRIVDIPDLTGQLETYEIELEKKYCRDGCGAVATARTDRALPGSDIGLNVTVLVTWLWVVACTPLEKIGDMLRAFFGLTVGSSGLAKMAIRVGRLLVPVHEEILADIKVTGKVLHADETGQHVKGNKWWLWVFGTLDAAYFLIDRSRGSNVVRRVLGQFFNGLLVVDGWRAYLCAAGAQQSCSGHLLRKAKKFMETYPKLRELAYLYWRLRRIVQLGERLQAKRRQLGEELFQIRRRRLQQWLVELTGRTYRQHEAREVAKKIAAQQDRLLTFVGHPGMPSHNNFAERLIRIGVLKRKISGGFQSEAGAEAYAVLLSVFATCRLRRLSFAAYLKASLRHYALTGRPLLLQDYTASRQDKTAA